MGAAKQAPQWLHWGVVLLLALCSFSCIVDARNHVVLSQVTSADQILAASKASASSTPSSTINNHIDWFNGLSPKYQRLVTIIFCVVAMLIGIFFVIFGYRIFRPSLALVGFIMVFILLWVTLTTHAPKLKWWAVLLISLACAIVAALLCFFVYHVGILLLGFALGFTVASLILSTPLGTKVITNHWAHFGIILGFALVFSILAIIFQRFLLILGTSALGAYLFCNAIDTAWMHTGILSNIVVSFFTQNLDHIPPINTWQAYVLLGGDLGLLLFGILIQYGITARSWDHVKAYKQNQPDEEREGLLVNAFYKD